MMRVTVHLSEQSQPCEFTCVKNTYQKGSFFCVLLETGAVHKFPIDHIFRVIEES